MGALPLLQIQLLWIHHIFQRHMVRWSCTNHMGRLLLLRLQLLWLLPSPTSQLCPPGHTTLLFHVVHWYHMGVLPLLWLLILRLLCIVLLLANGHTARLLHMAWKPTVDVLPLLHFQLLWLQHVALKSTVEVLPLLCFQLLWLHPLH